MMLQYFVNELEWCVCALVIDLVWDFYVRLNLDNYSFSNKVIC